MRYSFFTVFLFTVVVCVLTPITTVHNGAAFDGRYYLAMAQWPAADPLFALHPPWSWRVLTPWLVRLFPRGMEVLGFRIVNGFAAGMSLWLLLHTLQKLNFSLRSSWAATLMYASVFWTVQSAFHFPVMVDAGGQLFAFWILSLMARAEYRLLPFVFFFAVLQKESLLLLAPVVAMYRYSQSLNERESLLYFALLLTVSVIPLGFLRQQLPGVVPYYPEAVLRVTFLKQVFSSGFYSRFVIALFSGLSIFPLFLLGLPAATLQYLKKNPYLVVYLLLTGIMLFGGSGKSRLFLHALAPCAIITAHLIDTFVRQDRQGTHWLAGVIALSFLVNFKFHGLQNHEVFRTWINPLYTSLTYGEPPVFVKLPLTYAFIRLGILLLCWGLLLYRYRPFCPPQTIDLKQAPEASRAK